MSSTFSRLPSTCTRRHGSEERTKSARKKGKSSANERACTHKPTWGLSSEKRHAHKHTHPHKLGHGSEYRTHNTQHKKTKKATCMPFMDLIAVMAEPGEE